MTRDELAQRMHAVVENPDDWDREPETYIERYLRMADAVLAAIKPTTTTNDDERQKLWREAFFMVLRHEYTIRADYTDMGYVAGIAASHARVFADAALAADAEKWGAK